MVASEPWRIGLVWWSLVAWSALAYSPKDSKPCIRIGVRMLHAFGK